MIDFRIIFVEVDYTKDSLNYKVILFLLLSDSGINKLTISAIVMTFNKNIAQNECMQLHETSLILSITLHLFNSSRIL